MASASLVRPSDRAEPVTRALCPLCGGAFARARPAWLLVCAGCGLLHAAAPHDGAADAIDEDHRGAALRRLRADSFRRTLDALSALAPPAGRRLLDVGCAHGWFVEAAAARGYQAHGLEPEAAMVAQARSRGLAVRTGRFPDAIGADERYDVIAFNDVLEHLPDPVAALAACRTMLAPDGVLVVALPLSGGAFYRAATLLARLGIAGPLERLWQRGFPSPHTYYFSAGTVARLCARLGYAPVARWPTPPVRLAGLWSRLRYDRTRSLGVCAVVWLAVAAALPFLPLLPPDTVTLLLRRS